MNIFKATVKINSVFLAIVLVAGTFASISPSFFITGVNAQSESYDYGMDDKYNKKSYENSYDSDYEKDSYDKRQYGNSYEPDYSDVNQYTPDYNDYYKPMEQQQSSYDNNNDGYDNNQKIPYKNNYDDTNKYSKYPTKDKKYVCQTGQFEGFFVASLEFCKLEIPTGPQGPEGPPGQINFTNTYLVVGPGASTGENASRAFSVSFCDAGDIVLEGGGGVASFTDEGLSNVKLLIRETVDEASGYRVGGVAANTQFDSNAICIDNPPLR